MQEALCLKYALNKPPRGLFSHVHKALCLNILFSHGHEALYSIGSEYAQLGLPCPYRDQMEGATEKRMYYRSVNVSWGCSG